MKTLLLVSCAFLASCGGGDGGGGSTGLAPEVNPGLPEVLSIAPENLGDGWTPSTPAAEGMDANGVRATLESIRDGDWPRVDSMVVVRHGRLVAEGYFNGYGRDTLHDLRSTGKSITSA